MVRLYVILLEESAIWEQLKERNDLIYNYHVELRGDGYESRTKIY